MLLPARVGPQSKPNDGAGLPGAGTRRPASRWRRFVTLALLSFHALAASAQSATDSTNPPNAELAKKFADAFAQLPPIIRHYEGVTEAEVADRLRGETNFQNIVREKVAQRWFAALISTKPSERFAITQRFATLKEFLAFVQERKAVVEVSAYDESAARGGKGRRISATELAEIKREPHEQPLLVSLVFKDIATGELRDERVEFGFNAATSALALNRAYESHRQLQQAAHDILRTRDADGELSAQAQWDALKSAVDAQHMSISELPERPLITANPFVAFEFAVDEFGNFTNVVRAYRESDVQRRIMPDAERHSIQVLALQRAGRPEAIAAGFRVRGTSDELEAVPNPITGQDVVELRVQDPNEPDPRRWHVLEFGEAEVLQQSALAKFGLITAHLEGQRKQLALRRTRWSLFAEPVFAGLNIGGGVAGVGFPLGEAARLFYDAAFGPLFIPQLPTVKELRELFLLLAAKDKHPRLRVVPADFLTVTDVRELRAAMKNVSDAEAEEFLRRASDTDLQAMQKLAKWQNLDAKYSLLSSLLINAAKVSGAAESGWMKDLLNNSRATISGDVSVKTILALMMGGKTATPLSGASLESLALGKGPGAAWLQYFDVGIDLRAVLNTVTRLAQGNERDRELRKPFPYAPRADDLAAYEIRIFGYPLLMWYKRGLLKDDVAAFQNDYAYGIVGSRIVEHFPTKESMLDELRAGRLAPLGFVRVNDGKGGTTESRLVVFAHHLAEGKHRGQTALVIYGLQAFSDYAVEMEHEMERFRAYERALQESGVIEKLVRAEAPEEISLDEFAPKIRTDAEASREFAALLGGLRELERHRQLRKWGVPVSTEDERRDAALRAELAKQGIRADDPNESPLLGVDRFNSSLLYKKIVDGRWREVKLTLIPSLADIDRELKKAEASQRLEMLRRHAVSLQGDGIVLLNEVREREGKLEIGPLLRDTGGQIFGAGVRNSAAGLNEVFSQLSQLPITNQARLLFNQFAATPVELELGGEQKKVFLTVEFPIDRELKTEQINPLSGEPEISTYQNGRRTRLATNRRVVELAYDEANVETRSAVYLNRGTRRQPNQGPLLEETRTVETWFRDPHPIEIDPALSRIAKLHVNHVTGQMSHETFGLFPQPVEVADDFFVTRNQFDSYGLLQSAAVAENGKVDLDFQRAELERVLHPLAGRERFRLTAKAGGDSASPLSDLKARGFQMEVEQFDFIKKLAVTNVFDLARFGRRSESRWLDTWAGANSFRSRTRFEYRDDFAFGLIPQRAVTRGEATGATLTEVETTAYDPLTRQLTGTELDYAGKRTRKIWDARWQNPIHVESDLRATIYAYNRDETEITGSTQSRADNEKLSEFAGRFDAATQMWKSSRTNFFRPQIQSRTETETRSGFGKWIATTASEVFETRPAYDMDGREIATSVWRRDPTTGQFDIAHRQEDDYLWRDGGRDARVRTFVDGQFYDAFRIVTDAEGRTTTDGIKQLPGLDLQTAVVFAGATDRPLKAELKQNGALRLTREYLPEIQSTNGAWLLPAKLVPYWGLTSTQFVRLDDPLARPQATHFENGERVEVREWHDGTSIAKISELLDRHGRAKERFTTELRASEESGLPYDLLRRYKLNFWGGAGLAEEKALVRGTDISFFKSTIDEKVYFDISKVYETPLFALDRQAQDGAQVTIAGQRRTNVVAVFSGSFSNWPSTTATTNEPLLRLQMIDLRGLFQQKFSNLEFDRAGNVLEEIIGTISHPGQRGYADSNLFLEAGRADAGKRFRYSYDPGWLVEARDPQTSGRMLAFTNQALTASAASFRVNDSGWRETATRIVGQQADSQEELLATNRTPYIFRRSQNPREREFNPHLPGQPDRWTAWTATEQAADGRALFDTETFFDAQGRARVRQSHKRNSANQNGTKTVYSIADPPAGVFKRQLLAAGKNTVALDLAGRADFSGSDFVYFYAENPDRASFSIAARDTAGREVKIYRRDSEDRQDGLLTWAIESANIRWLPDIMLPEQGALVNAPASLAKTGRVVALSVHDLAQAGLEIHRVTALELQVNGRAGGSFGVSPLFHLARGGSFLRDAESFKFAYAEENHSSGLKTFTKTRKRRTEAEALAGLYQNAVVELDGRPVALGHTRSRGSLYPVVVMMDYADPDAPQALYAMLGTDGRFLEFYKTVKRGDAQVYSVSSGFEIPRVDVTRAAILDDEIAPGYVAYGNNYLVRGEIAKGRGWLGGALANFHNRIVANAFKYGADQFLKPSGAKGELATHFSQLHHAATQANEINQLPMLAEALLARRDLPWGTPTVARVEDWELDRANLSKQLLTLGTNYPTGLLPTAPNTATEVYVDTVKEAALIQLAIELKQDGVARDLLEFYWKRSQGGAQPLHASYDAMTGAALQKEPNARRAQAAQPTAEAQLAIAAAAFRFGVEAPGRDFDQAFTLGKNLTGIVLTNFMLPAGGITEKPLLTKTNQAGFTLWPEPERFFLRSNARAYLLFRNLTNIMGRYSMSGEWGLRVRDAVRLQHAWLMTNLVAQMERTGVAPKGLFQIQDIYEGTTALGIERWTSAEDWLVFLEAAEAMGVPREQTRRWLENLARVHGVSVDGKWGLDWSVPLVRPDAISPELTAKFWRVAKLLEHEAARDFASRQLSLLRENRDFPDVVTRARPDKALESGQGFPILPHHDRKAWPTTLAPFAELFGAPWDFSKQHQLATVQNPPRLERSLKDTTVWLWCAGIFFGSVVAFNFFWWLLRYWRQRHRALDAAHLGEAGLVSATVMARAEERWAKRVLGVKIPAGAEKTRFSNATVEVNFHMQLRAIYKLVVEWRRRENGWAEDDERLVEGDTDEWLNGLDEFASLVGIYMRWVIKAGMKDGFTQADPLAEHEDSNHIWSRLLMYLAEYYWGMVNALQRYDNVLTPEDKHAASREVGALLNDMGLRERQESFDAREAFHVPANPRAFDLLVLQKPGMTLTRVVDELEAKLNIPRRHIVRLVTKYKEFKQREHVYPLHPYLIEAAKLLPHFLLMGLGALVWYNEKRVGDEPLTLFVWEKLMLYSAQNFFSWPIAIWALPLLLGGAASIFGHWVKIYRWQAAMQVRAQSDVWLYQTMTSFFTRTTAILPETRKQWWWNPAWFERAGWTLRAIGFLALGAVLLRLETPNFVTFLFVKGILAMLAFVEAGAIVLPALLTFVSKFLQDWTVAHPQAGGAIKFLNLLNLTATRPTSVLWQSVRYHFQATAPSGDFLGIIQAIVFYFLQAGVFFFVGGYLCQEMFPLWFTEKYLAEADWKLFFGGLIFWNTMYLLRYGLFLLATGISSLLATFPLRTLGAALALAQLSLALFNGFAFDVGSRALGNFAVLALALALMLFEEQVLAWLRSAWPFRARRRETQTKEKLARIKQDQSATLGVIYMSGDDLCYQKLTPALLMTRWRLLRDKLDSQTIHWLFGMAGQPSDAELETQFQKLYEAEKKHDVTLWHPLQLHVASESAKFSTELGVNIAVESGEQRQQLLQAWHARRWLVTMMSTAGHSQDTAINLVDIALRLEREGLAANTAFYLIQNKYDNNDNNRPSQLPYDKGELGHRNKLARLLCAVAPGARAYSLQNWTPFGFKAGGLTGMDLAYEETMKLSTILVLDRNATVNDLDSLMLDLARAMTDPGVVIVIPGRGTTNTLTPLGQASQLVEEGHRSFAKGLMAWMGGTGSEIVGTGWGNILAVFYGRVQRAMMDANTPKRPLTSRMRRGSSFGARLEGLIGFSPHAVGISEDTWSVSQTAHNAIALGHRVKFLLSQAMWHKIRETWSHAEWLSAFPRWSGGFVQMMHDPIMQQINDFGPLSIFAKEIRANSGRYFLTALFALASILLMPFAIIFDVAPFVQILIVLWNFGFIMNQVLTMHGLQTYLEGAGFHRVPALVGAVGTGLLCVVSKNLQPLAPGLIVLGFLFGGFIVGFGRWFYYRLRDVILFGPQLVLHALGQLLRQSLEFVASGASPEDAKGVNMAFRTWAGPREDRPHEKFPSIFNFRTVVWLVGGTSLLVHVLALGSLDMFNVLLLLPSLLFSVSTFLGPFLTKPKSGNTLGWRVVFPKGLAWGSCFVIYMLVSWLVAQGGWLKAIGITLLSALFGFLLTRALRYLGFHGKIQRLRRSLTRQLTAAGVANAEAESLSKLVIEQNASATAKMQTALTQAGAAPAETDSILRFTEGKIRPVLRAPLTDLTEGRFANSRFASEFNASFVLALFTLGMFYVVPVPGLFVFAAHNYHISLGIGTVLRVVGAIVGLAIVSLWAGRLVEWLERSGFGGGLRQRTETTYQNFQQLWQHSRKLTPQEISSVYALFTDVQTYVDQRSFGYARRTLRQIETVLATANAR